jgi:hypothetical protein
LSITANFSDDGLAIGQQKSNLTYMYGLSDFFTVMFEDTSTHNLLLEASSEYASEVYSRFLQLTSTLSLADIQATTHSTIKLVLLNDTDAVEGKLNTFKLPEEIQSSKFIANRAFLPTELLEDKVDYVITQEDDGVCYVQFAAAIDAYAVSSRLLPDGVTTQYALWFVDAELDEKLLSNYYGNLIGMPEENSSEAFAGFLYGLYFMYINGPKLDIISRGLNLVLGIPLARSVERVIDVRMYLDTDQYLVICDQNQYLIPYGLPASVEAGDTLFVGQPLASWVDVKDYEHDGEWWTNLSIPERLIPAMPLGQKDRYATAGSHFDYIMRNFLKKHTFLVRVKVDNFKNIQRFAQVSDLIKQAKPTYTNYIYVWTIERLQDDLYLNESLHLSFNARWCDHFRACISRMRRDHATVAHWTPGSGFNGVSQTEESLSNLTHDPYYRGCSNFIRFNIDKKWRNVLGADPYISDFPTQVDGLPVSGFVNTMKQFRDNTIQETAWMRSKVTRGEDSYRGKRSAVGFYRDVLPVEGLSMSPPEEPPVDGLSVSVKKAWGVHEGRRVVPMYMTTVAEMISKAESVGWAVPSPSQWWFDFFNSDNITMAIDDLAINEGLPPYNPSSLRENYTTFCFRSTTNLYLPIEYNQHSTHTWAPDPTEILDEDYVVCVRITPELCGVYWVTTNQAAEAPSFFDVYEVDPLVMTYETAPIRSGGYNGAPWYVLRGSGVNAIVQTSTAINADAIDVNPVNTMSGPSSLFHYSDLYNTTPIKIDRGWSSTPTNETPASFKFVHAMESL